ncbi:Drug resistance transporter, EmrB/QacA subfamily [Frankia canadensis]|uniref:Drug resistance transporter, EmrB/QacA subfamily n=1 Tax=Frankia canadensis TaxID=1836972 RepID=A0A2I2KRN6_9ACTN|nr:DHA2 family efflux MFS transporter permease subunit [Frankia canadensis]SNQ48333.1 Drug resistance transporter, EmrB/QacA subfamily [Frankia canadensis]SOU55623.1 Drug resistance transporter, EmrB/QacA subfamily [Frankia canadensis]
MTSQDQQAALAGPAQPVIVEPATDPAAEARHRRRLAVALALIVTCQLMVVVDGTIVNVALPKITEDLSLSTSGAAWVQVGYSLAFGGLLLLGGRAGDAFGRRRLFVGGLVVFTLASLAAGLAGNAEMLIAARAVQGAGAAFAAPASLALLATTFADGPARHRALGVFSMMAGLGLTLGLILGGLLATASWRWVFFINLPFGAATALLAPRFLKDTPRHSARFDVGGAITSALGVASLAYGFIRAASDGWSDGLTLSAFGAAAVLLVAFALIERGAEQPIVAYRLLGQRTRAAAYTNMLLLGAAMGGVMLYMSVFVQQVLGFSVLRAGLAFLPMAALQFVCARTAPTMMTKLGGKRLTTIGTVMLAGAAVWLVLLDDRSSYPASVLGPLLLFGVGIGLTFMPLNSVILAGLPPQATGSASGLLQCLQQVGSTMGVAVLTTVYGTSLRDSAAHPVPGLSPAAQLRHAWAEGIASAMYVPAALAAAAVVLAVVVIRDPARSAPQQ